MSAPEPVRLCLLGDSHVAAMGKYCADGGHCAHNIEPHFFAAFRARMTEMMERDGKLYPTTDRMRYIMQHRPGGADHIDPDAYDLFVVVGLRMRPIFAVLLAKFYGIYGKFDGRRLISKAAFEAAVRDSLAVAPALPVIAKLREVTDKPIIVLPQPLPSERLAEKSAYNGLKREETEFAYRAFAKALGELLAGDDVDIVPQDKNTLAKNGLTQDRYSVGSMKLAGDFKTPHDDTDFTHLNGLYGGVQMRQIAEAFARRDKA